MRERINASVPGVFLPSVDHRTAFVSIKISIEVVVVMEYKRKFGFCHSPVDFRV